MSGNKTSLSYIMRRHWDKIWATGFGSGAAYCLDKGLKSLSYAEQLLVAPIKIGLENLPKAGWQLPDSLYHTIYNAHELLKTTPWQPRGIDFTVAGIFLGTIGLAVPLGYQWYKSIMDDRIIDKLLKENEDLRGH